MEAALRRARPRRPARRFTPRLPGSPVQPGLQVARTDSAVTGPRPPQRRLTLLRPDTPYGPGSKGGAAGVDGHAVSQDPCTCRTGRRRCGSRPPRWWTASGSIDRYGSVPAALRQGWQCDHRRSARRTRPASSGDGSGRREPGHDGCALDARHGWGAPAPAAAAGQRTHRASRRDMRGADRHSAGSTVGGTQFDAASPASHSERSLGSATTRCPSLRAAASAVLPGVSTQVSEYPLTGRDMCATRAPVIAGVGFYLGDVVVFILGSDQFSAPRAGHADGHWLPFVDAYRVVTHAWR